MTGARGPRRPPRHVAGGPADRPGGRRAAWQQEESEAQQAIEAIRAGNVDALVVGPPGKEQVYVLASADRPYRLIVEAMSEGAALVSPRGVILDANPRLGQLAGRPTAELVGTAAVDLASAASRPELARALEVQPGGLTRGQADLARPDGTTVPVLAAVSAFDLDGLPVRGLVLTDLTTQRRAEARIRALNADLEERVAQRTADLERANQDLESFTYSVSHDLRAPLRAMSGFSEVMLADYGAQLDEAGRGYIERIQAAAGQMTMLIDDLLQLSRVSRAELNLAPVDLSAEAAAVAADLRSRDPGRQVEFRIQPDVEVTADRSLLRTVVQNLLDNAWKFTARRRDAVIQFASAPASGGGMCCYVRDNGAGFDPAYAKKLFQPFQRLHPARDFPGTGIGLASVRRIVERHGGRVWAEGAVGQGATFYFTLGAQDTRRGSE